MGRTLTIRARGDSDEEYARRIKLARQQDAERERRASMRLVAKAAAKAILEGKSACEPTASEVRAVRALTDDEIRAAVEAGALTKQLKRKAAAERSAILKSTREVHK
jgi:hypothetical protein